MNILFIDNWTSFKALLTLKQLGMHYIEVESRYDIYATEGSLIWNITLLRNGNSDTVDFETTYKALSNKPSFLLGQFRNRYLNITGNTTVTVKSGGGVIRGLTVNNDNTSGTITIYDNTQASGTKIATMELGSPSGGLLSSTGQRGPNYINMTAEFATGLTIVTSGSTSNNITVYYQ